MRIKNSLLQRKHIMLALISSILYMSSFSQNAWQQMQQLGNNASTPSGIVAFSIGSKGYVSNGGGAGKDLWEYDPANDTWTQKADLSGPGRSYAVGFSIGNKGYIGTGSGQVAVLKDFWEYDPLTNLWTRRADFGGQERYVAVGFSANGKGYIGTGNSPRGISLKDFWEYDPAADSWKRIADFGGAERYLAVGFGINGKGYVGTGYTSSFGYNDDFWEYDPITDIWTEKASFGGTHRYTAVGFATSKKGYIGCGYDGDGQRGDFWEYDPSYDSWIQIADYGGGVANLPIGFAIDDKGYVGFGSNFLGAQTQFWQLDPEINGWTQMASLGGYAKANAIAFSIGNQGYVGLGVNGAEKRELWQYDSQTDSWTQMADFVGRTRVNAVAFSINGKGYVGTGQGSNSSDPNSASPFGTDDFWEYDPITNNWLQKANFSGGIRRAAVGFTIGNKGYLGTGLMGNDETKDIWEYDPNTDIWTRKADFGGFKRYGAVAFSIGTLGYIGTGYSSSGNGGQKDFWAYDPNTDTWTQKADCSSTPRYSAVGFSAAGKGYIGTAANGTQTKDFWEYEPSNNTWTQRADFGGTPRNGAIAFSIKNSGYIGFGGATDGIKNDLWKYTPGTIFYKDNDGDGYGDPNIPSQLLAEAPYGYVNNNQDCNDNNNLINPGALEICDGLDNNCNGQIDEGLKSMFYRDQDNDGYGVTSDSIFACSAPQGYVSFKGDCNDANATIYPGAPEICDGLDNDCNGQIDEVVHTFYQDFDGDGFGNPAVTKVACTKPNGYVADNTDCDDKDKTVYTGAPELCDGKDNNCNGLIDDNVQTVTYYRDADGDGYGTNTLTIQSCSVKTGYVSKGGDCNDKNAKINPGMTEICGNGIDDNCNGQIDENCPLTSVTINDGAIYESQGVVRVTVSLSNSSSSSVKVNYQTSDGTATAGKDYKAVSGTLNIPAGSLSGIISITILADKITEPDEIFYVNLSGAIGATINKNIGAITIKDGAPPATLTSSVVKINTSEEVNNASDFAINVFPNPSHNYFNLTITSESDKTVAIRIMNILGNIVERKSNLAVNGTLQFGRNYRPGVYFVEVTQGNLRRFAKIIKGSE